MPDMKPMPIVLSSKYNASEKSENYPEVLHGKPFFVV